ncbi:unnamed protein product [Polarella glacialis]|uniref:Uncharacterized protein n=1 Tax=Polarella glacialis TaxID=89957 RepID=A0A813KBD8_POLGL|nr:unnamed protein product [Polarella glacialis]
MRIQGTSGERIRLVPISFLLYQFSLLWFVACFAVVFGVDNDCQKRNLIGTDRNMCVCIRSPRIVMRFHARQQRQQQRKQQQRQQQQQQRRQQQQQQQKQQQQRRQQWLHGQARSETKNISILS